MDLRLQFKVNNHLYLRDPEGTQIGREIVQKGIELIDDLGFEQFTFKKLAIEIGTTEATVYRYFENKHRLLLYILNWYWSYLEYLFLVQLNGVEDSKEKMKKVLEILSNHLPEEFGEIGFDLKKLIQIVIKESSKSYLVKDVSEINKEQVFKPYKDLCDQIAQLIVEIKPSYKYPHSLASTIIESAHHQTYFTLYLPKLTDSASFTGDDYTFAYLSDLVASLLDF